jgi:hypothetical protein
MKRQKLRRDYRTHSAIGRIAFGLFIIAGCALCFWFGDVWTAGPTLGLRYGPGDSTPKAAILIVAIIAAVGLIFYGARDFLGRRRNR